MIDCVSMNQDGVKSLTGRCNLVGPPLYMWAVVDQNIVIQHMAVLGGKGDLGLTQ